MNILSLIVSTTIFAAACGGIVTVLPVLDEISEGVMFDDMLNETELSSLYKFQENMDLVADLQNRERFNIRIEEIIDIKHSDSLSEAVGKFDTIMLKMKTGVTFNKTYCANINKMTDTQLQNALNTSISDEESEFIKTCIATKTN